MNGNRTDIKRQRNGIARSVVRTVNGTFFEAYHMCVHVYMCVYISVFVCICIYSTCVCVCVCVRACRTRLHSPNTVAFSST